MEEDSQEWEDAGQEVAVEDAGLEDELDDSDLDDIPLVSDSEPSPGPSTERSERTAGDHCPAGSDGDASAVDAGGAAAGTSSGGGADHGRGDRDGSRPQARVPPKFSLQLPGSGGGLGGRSGAALDGGPDAVVVPGASDRSSSKRGAIAAGAGAPLPALRLGSAQDLGDAGGDAGSGGCVRTAKPPPLALFSTSASSPVQSPAHRSGGSAGLRLPLQPQRPLQQQQQGGPPSEPLIRVQLLLPAFDLVLRPPAAASAEGQPTAAAPAVPPAIEAAGVREAIARALGVAPRHLLFYQAQASDLGANAAAAAGTTAAAASGNAGGTGSRLSVSSSSNGNSGGAAAVPGPRRPPVRELSSGNGGATAGAAGAGEEGAVASFDGSVPIGSTVVVGLSDGACTFSLADLEDSLRRAELAAAALKEQNAAYDALQQQLVLKGLEVAERTADAARLREREIQLQQELWRIKTAHDVERANSSALQGALVQLKQQYNVMRDLLHAQAGAAAGRGGGASHTEPAAAAAAGVPAVGGAGSPGRQMPGDERLASLVARLTEPGMLDKMEALAGHLERMSLGRGDGAGGGGGGNRARGGGSGKAARVQQ